MQTVLVADDEQISLGVFRAVLELHGYRVVEAIACERVKRECATYAPDVLIADIFLPGSSGTEIALTAIASCPGIHVLFCSGSPMELWDARDIRNLDQMPLGSFEFLPKPFTAPVLLAKVRELLQHPRVASARCA